MAELGYDRYGAQGGDWGAIATTLIGVVDPAHAIGLHLNMVVAGPPGGEGVNPLDGLSESELAALDDMNHFREEETGYQAIQGTKPQTLGLRPRPTRPPVWRDGSWRSSARGAIAAATSSRASRRTSCSRTSRCTGSRTRSRPRCGSIASRSGPRRFGPAADYIDVPTGAAIFPKELYPAASQRGPRPRYNIVHWTEMPRGGHFAAMEEPDLLVDDVRSFFRLVR